MAVNLTDADTYISANVIDSDEWTGTDAAKKQRILTVASRTLAGLYVDYTIPDNAVYEYAAVLATVFNDTGRLQRQGVASFNVSGVTSFTFAATGAPADGVERYVPKISTDLINADQANIDAKLPSVGGRIRWTVV